ncbi:TIGR03899 family protein [Vibrio astriarenae]|uniref:TIGR03899 family protein n=1 Tax=Vibrio astriarenae TaxID=1481923 RepID=UPI00373683C1
MSQDSKNITVVVEETKAQDKKKSYIKESGKQILAIAEEHGLDAQLNNEQIDTTALERALQRERKRRELRQKNLESIMKAAYGSCKNESAGQPDPDWLHRFFDMAQEIHSPMMQKLWAQVLKREVTNPGSTSMKALQILHDMSPKEAQILQRAASLACSFGSDSSKKLFIGVKTKGSIFTLGKRISTHTVSLGAHQLPYSSLLVLMELGLVHASELESGEIEMAAPLPILYQGRQMTLQTHQKSTTLLYYRFTPTGNELCRLLGNKPNNDYWEQVTLLLQQTFAIHSDNKGSVNHSV